MTYIKKYKKNLCFDLDGVICLNTYGDYEKAKPINDAIKKINYLYDNNYYIIIFTARYMGFAKGDLKKAIKKGYAFTQNQLNLWGLKYHKLLFGKPEYDIIIDDKSYNYNQDWIKNLE
tara:strand:- start:191 stop:544 length:354 start_codon:yes stop_codon:yes gene_type:complete